MEASAASAASKEEEEKTKEEGRRCPALRMSIFTYGWWCPALRMSVFNCLKSFVSQSGWWCPALRMSVLTCLSIHLSPSLAGGVWLSGCLSFTCLPSFVSQSGWWCPALRMSLLTWFCSFVARFPDVSLYLSTCKCLPEWRVLSGTPRISFSLSRSLSLYLFSFIIFYSPNSLLLGSSHSFLRRVLLFAGGGVRLS